MAEEILREVEAGRPDVKLEGRVTIEEEAQ